MANPKPEDSILLSVKRMLGGLDEENKYFDLDLIIYINSIFTVLAQVGVGPSTPYKIVDATDEWSDFECYELEAVKEYIYLKTKLTFDPPSSGSVMQAFKERANELEWRLMIFSEELNDGE